MATDVSTYTYGTALLTRWEAEVPIAREGNTQFFPVRALCLVLGIDSRTQLVVLQADSRYRDALRDIPQQTAAGWRVATWIRRAEAALWLAGIDPARCSLTARGPLADFQRDLMLEADRLLFGAAPAVRPERRGEASYSQREEIHMACQDCGAPHIVVIVNGVAHVERERRE
jgi:P22_AR N-terminal domain